MSDTDKQTKENIEEEKVDEEVVEEKEEIEKEKVEEEKPVEDAPVEEVTKKELKDIEKAEKKGVEIPEFRAGDTVRILYRIIEGDKTRIQPYEGIVIAKKGKGISKTFTVRRIGVDGVGVERIFPLYSPNITKLEVKKRGRVKRSKLYYLRDKKGRAAIKVKERRKAK